MKKFLKFAGSDMKVIYATSWSTASRWMKKQDVDTYCFNGEVILSKYQVMWDLQRITPGIYKKRIVTI